MRGLIGSAALVGTMIVATAALAQTDPGSTRKRTRIVIHPRGYSAELPPTIMSNHPGSTVHFISGSW